MRKLALLATLAIAGSTVAVFHGRPSPAPFSLRPVKVSPVLDTYDVSVEFTISNPHGLAFHAKRLEHWTGDSWLPGPEARGFAFYTAGSTNGVLTFPKALRGRVRLRVETFRPTHGLSTFWFRLQQRFVNHRAAALNPFDSTLTIYRREAEVVSDVFDAP